ncbi:hypothetical protein [Streptomyces sp. HUAS TT7]|uniref:hypothetical protein n=1 Tax=Streptomyces sp. HUAS TT7 TaxID=3447507 RepID=UPI003F658F35
MQRKTKIWIIAIVGLLAFGGLLSLFEDKPDKAEAEPKPTTAPAKPADKPSEAASKPSGVPSPDAGRREALIRALRTIDAGLVVKEDGP